jgi:hypothetical protein
LLRVLLTTLRSSPSEPTLVTRFSAATDGDPSWTALITAPYPEQPSGHICFDGGSLHVLEMFFGTDTIRFGVTSVRFPGETRYFDRFSDALKEIIDARVWAGLHFRTADEQAQILGSRREANGDML